MLLSPDQLIEVVRNAPLVSMDLIVRNPAGEILLGYRSNRPAQNWWFVPGGRMAKGETLAAAFRRITRNELGREFELGSAIFLGVYEHFYEDNFLNREGVGTHYVVLAHALDLSETLTQLPADQHGDYRWFGVNELLVREDVHANTRAYFRGGKE